MRSRTRLRRRLASIARDNRARVSIIRICQLEASLAFRFRGARRDMTGRERDVARFRNGSRNANTTARVSITRAYRRHVLDSSLDSSIAISERSVPDRQ